MEQNKVRYNLKIHFVRKDYGTCYNYFTQMAQIVQLEGLQLSDENIQDLGGKPGVGSFFKCCCFVDPQIWSSEQQVHQAIYSILLSRNMFPSRGYEERLKVERHQDQIQFLNSNINTFPPSQNSLFTERLFQQDLNRHLSTPNPFRNDDFLQHSQTDTTNDVTSVDILSCIEQNNFDRFNPQNSMNQQQPSSLGYNNQIGQRENQQQQQLQSDSAQSRNLYQIDLQNPLRTNLEQQIDSNNQELQQNNMNLIQLMDETKNGDRILNNENNIQSLLNYNERQNNQQIQDKHTNLYIHKSDQDEYSSNSSPKSSSDSLPLNNCNDQIENAQAFNQTDTNLQKSSPSQNKEFKLNSSLQKQEESNQKIDESYNYDKDSQNEFSQNEKIKLAFQSKQEVDQDESITNTSQHVQNNEFYNEQDSEIKSQIEGNDNQTLTKSSYKPTNLGENIKQADIALNTFKQDSYDPFLNETLNDYDISKDQSSQIQSRLYESTLNDSDIRQEEQKDKILDIEQMKNVDMKHEKEQVYVEQTNYQIKALQDDLKQQKQIIHQLQKEKQKDKEKLNILEQNAINYLTENSELKQQLNELQEQLNQYQKQDFDQDTLAKSIAQLQEINQQKAELMEQKQQNQDNHKDLYIEELKSTLNEARNEILFMRKELQQKDEMLEILKEIQKSFKK
ncbi:hypothetical protein ABPG74_010082 [Tetrahymena malaccensis]